jgi:thymidylate kinase
MLIILEGCDGTGKTTLANSLSKVLNAEIIHCTRETPNNYGYFSRIIEASKNKNIIADRFMYGQFVYQLPIERNLTPQQLYMLEVKLIEAGGKVVHVTAPIHEIQNRLQARLEVTPMPVAEIVGKFTKLFEKSSINVVEWKTGGELN